jgi:hypothetical protein
LPAFWTAVVVSVAVVAIEVVGAAVAAAFVDRLMGIVVSAACACGLCDPRRFAEAFAAAGRASPATGTGSTMTTLPTTARR